MLILAPLASKRILAVSLRDRAHTNSYASYPIRLNSEVGEVTAGLDLVYWLHDLLYVLCYLQLGDLRIDLGWGESLVS
jgi:hypothetical protein